GSKKKIKDIVAGDTVLGLDTSGNVVHSKVLDVFNNGKTNQWLKIKFHQRTTGMGNSYGKLVCTPDHLILTENGWKEAKDINSSDVLNLIRNDRCLDSVQEQVIIGKLLGDGHLLKRNTAAKLEFGHKIDH